MLPRLVRVAVLPLMMTASVLPLTVMLMPAATLTVLTARCRQRGCLIRRQRPLAALDQRVHQAFHESVGALANQRVRVGEVVQRCQGRPGARIKR